MLYDYKDLLAQKFAGEVKLNKIKYSSKLKTTTKKNKKQLKRASLLFTITIYVYTKYLFYE